MDKEKQNRVMLFQDKEVRTHWDDNAEEWFFSVVDVVGILSEQPDIDGARNYWKVLKHRLNKEGSQLVTDCNQLELIAQDGKMRKTDVLDTRGILRLVQSIPSPKAEPFKVWLAQVGAERIEQIIDPERSFEQGMADYTKKGYSREWINQRLLSIEMRKELTNEWQDRGIDDKQDYAILTNEMTRAWSGKTVKGYKKHKDMKKGNLRDNMTNLELVLNMLAEVSTTEISKEHQPAGMDENMEVARQGGYVAKTARLEIEKKIGRSVISKANAGDKATLDESPKTLGIKSPLGKKGSEDNDE